MTRTSTSDNPHSTIYLLSTSCRPRSCIQPHTTSSLLLSHFLYTVIIKNQTFLLIQNCPFGKKADGKMKIFFENPPVEKMDRNLEKKPRNSASAFRFGDLSSHHIIFSMRPFKQAIRVPKYLSD